jgi:hypothetical protein
MKLELKNIIPNEYSMSFEKTFIVELNYSDYEDYQTITNRFASDFKTWVAISEDDWQDVQKLLSDDKVIDCRFLLQDADGNENELGLLGKYNNSIYFAIDSIENVDFEEA